MNHKGAAPILILVAVIGLLTFLFASSSLFFKGNLFKTLFPKGFLKAAGIVDLSFNPSAVTASPSGTFNVDLVMDTKTEQVTATQIIVKWDPQYLEATSVTQGSFLKGTISAPAIGSGEASMIFSNGITCTNPADPNTCTSNPPAVGQGVLATIAFKALQNTVTPVSVFYDPANTQISALNQGSTNVVGTLSPADVTISSQSAVVKTAQLSLNPATASAPSNQEIPIKVMARSDTDSANLFAARLTFDNTKAQVSRIDTTASFLTNWAEQTYDNTTGTISLVGGVPNPGIQTTGTDRELATIYFVGTLTGSVPINFTAASAVYRNSDNADILNTTSGSTLTITTTASPSPSPVPTPSPSPVPTPSPSPVPTPSPSPVASPSPSPSPSPLACALTGGAWSISQNPIQEGNIASLTVTGSGNCTGQQVAIEVREDDGVFGFGSDPVINNPVSPTFTASGTATTSWIAEYQVDGLNGVNDPPEYFFKATLIGTSSTITSSAPALQVSKLAGGAYKKGDGNRDGKVDLFDLSFLLTNWNKDKNADVFPAEININDDSVLNTFDFSGMIIILKAAGILSNTP